MPRRAALGFGLLGNVLIVGVTYIWGKYALLHIPPLTIGLLRFSVSAILLYFSTRIFYSRLSIEKKDLRYFWMLGAFAVPGNQLFFLMGLSNTTPAHSALMYSTLPIFVYIISLSLREERFAWMKTLGIILAFLGVYLILSENGIDFKSDYVIGDLTILVAVTSWSFYTVMGRPMIRKYGAFFVNARALTFGAIMFFPFGIYQTVGFDFTSAPLLAYGGVLWMTVMTSIVAYTLWVWALKHMESSKVGVVNNLQPVVTAIMSFFLFGETFSALFIGAGLIVIFGVFLTQKG
ncbi:MAG: EamA family transporter [candidate division Zixibacteria bacterium]|nr:EamA family transporter [candidate division Zixibacteria bacterium]